MRKVIVADNDADGVAHAYALAKRGYEVAFFSPNRYAVEKALRYKHLASHYFTRTEFMKLITEGRLTASQEINVDDAGILIIPSDTLPNEIEGINKITSLAKSLLKRTSPNYIILAGVNAIGTTAKAIASIMDYCPEIEQERLVYAGCPLHTPDKIPIYSKDGKGKVFKVVAKLYGKRYTNVPSPEVAEYITLLKVIEKYVMYYIGVQIFLNSENLDLSAIDQVTQDRLTLGFENKQIENVFNYLKRSEKIQSYTTRIISEIMRCRKNALSSSMKYARRMLRRLMKQKSNPKILAVVNSDEEQGVIVDLLPSSGMRVRVKQIDDIPLSESGYSFMEGFDIIISTVACPAFSRVLRGLDNVYVFDLMRPVRGG